MSGHSEAVQVPVARLHELANRGRGRAPVPASVTKADRLNSGGIFKNKPFAALARMVTGK